MCPRRTILLPCWSGGSFGCAFGFARCWCSRLCGLTWIRMPWSSCTEWPETTRRTSSRQWPCLGLLVTSFSPESPNSQHRSRTKTARNSPPIDPVSHWCTDPWEWPTHPIISPLWELAHQLNACRFCLWPNWCRWFTICRKWIYGFLGMDRLTWVGCLLNPLFASIRNSHNYTISH